MTNSNTTGTKSTTTKAVKAGKKTPVKTSILFLCTGNSARSIMAEAIANGMFGSKLEAVSAGSQPKPQPHPLALETLEQNGVSTANLSSKPIETFVGRRFDLCITLCDGSKESCPSYQGASKTVHWHLPDPPAASHPQDMFDAVFEVLEESIGLVANGPNLDPVANAAEAAKQISRRFSPKAI